MRYASKQLYFFRVKMIFRVYSFRFREGVYILYYFFYEKARRYVYYTDRPVSIHFSQ